MGLILIDFYKRLKKEWKIAFISTIILGLAIHIYKFTNALPNHDTLLYYYHDQNIIGSGRWLLSFSCFFSSFYDLPWLIGLLSIIIISITVVILIDTLKVENPVLIILISGITVAFPAITETFFFEYTADGYMIAMLLATLAVKLSAFEKNKWYHTFFSIVLICCACAIYQAYVSYALILAIIYFIFEILDGNHTSKEYGKFIFKQVIIYFFGLNLYYIIWKILLHIQKAEINNYQGINNMSLNIDTIMAGTKKTIENLWSFFFLEDVFRFDFSFYSILNILFFAVLLIAVVGAIVKTKTYKKPYIFIIFICIIAIPFASCIWNFVSDGVKYRPRMFQCLSLLYIFVGVLIEKYFSIKIKNVVGLILTVIIFNYSVLANVSYYYMNRTYFASYHNASEIVSEINNLNTDCTTIKVIGEKSYFISQYEKSKIISLFAKSVDYDLLTDENRLVCFLNETFYKNYTISDKKWDIKSGQGQQINLMNCWPEENSIQLIDDVIVIKLSE